MTVAVITLALAVLALGTGMVIAIRYAVKANDGAGAARQLLVDERIAHEAAKSELGRVKYELAQSNDALLAAKQTTARFSAEAEKKLDEPVNADLAPSDIEARRIRAAIKARAAQIRDVDQSPDD